MTFVYVTHDQAEALTMSDRIAVFNEGIIQQIATPVDLYERPANAFVAGFIGENNRLRGHIAWRMDGVPGRRVDGGDGVLLARAATPTASATPVLVSLRPERVRIDAAAGNLAEPPATARIEEVIYHGDHVRLRLSVCGYDDFVAKVPNIGLATTFAAGDAVRGRAVRRTTASRCGRE